MTTVCKFKFKKEVSHEFLEKQIAYAVLSAESIFGKAKVRIHSPGYLASDGKVVINVSSEVGDHIAAVFTGLMNEFVGEENFTVERIEGVRSNESD